MAIVVPPAAADDQTLPGAGNAPAAALAKKSPMVNSAYDFLLSQARRIKDERLLILYSAKGIEGLRTEVKKLRAQGII
jgi:hypothetical protein